MGCKVTLLSKDNGQTIKIELGEVDATSPNQVNYEQVAELIINLSESDRKNLHNKIKKLNSSTISSDVLASYITEITEQPVEGLKRSEIKVSDLIKIGTVMNV